MKTYKTALPELSLVRRKTDIPNVKISQSEDSAKYIRQFYYDDIGIYESFFLLLLNMANNTIGYVKISQGGVTGTIADVRLIAKYCVESLACNAIIAHNHPSGNVMPSQADKQITKKVLNALKLFECNLLDHIILTEESYYSFADEGLL